MDDNSLHFVFYDDGSCDASGCGSLEEDQADMPDDGAVAHVAFSPDEKEDSGFDVLVGLQDLSRAATMHRSVLEQALAMAFRAGVAHGQSLKIHETVREVLDRWVAGGQ